MTLHNDLPSDYPSSTAGISIHWHGFSLHSADHTASWYDGTPYIAQCPVAPGKHFVYRFLVTENPGAHAADSGISIPHLHRLQGCGTCWGLHALTMH